MTQHPRTPLMAALAAIVFLASGCGGGDDAAPDGLAGSSVQALPLPGPFAVGCSNVAQDDSRLSDGEDAEDYWEGVPAPDGRARQDAAAWRNGARPGDDDRLGS